MINLKIIPKTSGIYKFTNKINDKVYIGQAVNLRSRVKGHLNCVKKNHNYPIYNSMRKHNVENFELEILAQGNFSKTELDDLEVDFIRLYNSIDRLYGYNLTQGGEGTSGYKHTEQTKKKLSQAKIGKNLGKKYSLEHCKKISDSLKGKPKSETHKLNLTGKRHSEETKEKLSKIHKGKIISQEQKQKMRETKIKNGTLHKTNYRHSEETKLKMKNINKGRVRSNEAKLKTSTTLKRNYFVKKLSEEFYKVFIELNLF